VAEGGGGKTTIFIHLCEALCASGIRVYYFNVDGNPDDLKRHYKHATDHGYKVITPDARDGKSTNDAHDKLRDLAQLSADLHSTVFIIDTLKKFVDMLAKKEIKAFLMLLRALTTKGATVCLMAHTNKYKDENGSPMYEGTVDLRNDCDDLIYLNHTVDVAAGVQMVTSKPDKVRARFKPRSFKIDLVTREVTDCDEVVPIYSQDYQEILKAVMVAVRGGASIQKDVVACVKASTSHGERKVRNVLAHSSRPGGELVRTTGDNNSQRYAISLGLPPFPQY